MIQDIFTQIRISSDELRRHIDDFIKVYNGSSPSTIKTHQNTLKLFYSYFTEKNNFSFLVEDVKKYQKYLQKNKNMQPHSVKTYLSSLRRFCNYLVKNDVLEKNPVKRIKLKNPIKTNSLLYLNSNQIEGLIKGIDPMTPDGLRDFTIFSLIIYCQLSEYEIATLNYEDVQLHRKKWYLNIRGKERSGNEIIKVVEQAAESLLMYMSKYDPSLHDGHPLFFSFSNRSKNRQLSIRGIRTIVEKRMSECDSINIIYKKPTISILRNTSAILFAKRGESVENLMKRFKLKHRPTAEKYYKYIDKI